MSNAGIIKEKGDVFAVGTLTDNKLLRGDGEKRVQDSGITVDDSDNMSLVNTLSVVDTATTRSNLGLGSIATQAANSVSITGGSVTGITDLAVADGGTGASTAADARTNLGLGSIATLNSPLPMGSGGTDATSAADARTNLGLGTIATQAADSVAITGGSVTGITDLAVADGGTGRSSHTAYAVLCCGTDTTTPQQSIASVGSAGQILTSNGAGNLPTFQDVSGASAFPSFQLQVATIWNHSSIDAAATNLGVVDKRLYLFPFHKTKSIQLTNVGIIVTGNVAGSTARLGMYSIDSSTGAFTLVADYGTVSCATTGVKSITATTLLQASVNYMAAIVVDENAGAVSLQASTVSFPFFSVSSTFYSHKYKDAINPVNPLAESYVWTDLINGTGSPPIFVFQ